jgi:hypothetical protein
MTGKYLWTIEAQEIGTEDIDQPISNIQTINITYGRTLSTDPFKGGGATITGRRPDLLPTIFIGQIIYISTVGTTDGYSFYGYVTDFIVDYGIVPAEDVWTIVCEDALGSAGRATVTASVAAGTLTRTAMQTLGTPASIYPEGGIGFSNGTQKVSAINATNENLLSLFNKVIATEQGLIFNGAPNFFFGSPFKGMGYRPRNAYQLPVAEFTDTTPQAAALAVKYERIEFAGLADSYATKVIVDPRAAADQVAGTGNNVYTVSTFDENDAQAAATAAYILSTLAIGTEVPVSISCISEDQTTDKDLAAASGLPWVNIALRGNQYTCAVQGGTIFATPEQTRFTYNLTLQPQNSFNFVLDSTHYGKLDTNKLG